MKTTTVGFLNEHWAQNRAKRSLFQWKLMTALDKSLLSLTHVRWRRLAPIVKELEDHIKDTPGWSQRFEDAVKAAHDSGIIEMQAITTTSEYLHKINEWLYWIPKENEEGRDVYNRICLFYFIMNQPTNSWLTDWLYWYADALGKWLDEPESIKEVDTFKNSPPYNMKEYKEPRGGWRDFNDWFARDVKPGYRSVAAISDPHVIVNPTDYTYGGQFEIRSDTGVTIKGLHWNISELLKDCPYADAFQGGMFMHGFLGPNDYHRQHCPIGGKAVPIPDTDGVKTLVPYRTMDGAKQFDAPDTPGYQFAQNRGLFVMETAVGLVVILPMGMAQVSSVESTAETGVTLTKGEEISYFQFGGSDLVVVFQRQTNVNITAKERAHYKKGTVLGYAYPAGK
ncbi:MAG: hypothetical protein LQ343_006137 [Gyalolechia ehrenbergii]|nr:MAG: hypothetical protein LQ343_006137 [Gyalolechia ehrenbergii]